MTEWTLDLTDSPRDFQEWCKHFGAKAMAGGLGDPAMLIVDRTGHAAVAYVGETVWFNWDDEVRVE